MISLGRAVAGGVLVLLAATSAQAQGAGDAPAPISANRPGFAESADVVRKGGLQVEFGGEWERDDAGRTSTRTPVPALRVGLGSRVELQLSGDRYSAVGVKARVLDESAAGVALAVLGTVALPLWRAEPEGRSYDPSLRIALARSLAQGFGLSANAVVAIETRGGSRASSTAASMAVSRTFLARWSTFVEAYAVRPEGRGAQWSADGGLTHALGRRVQVDAWVGRGLSAGAPRWSGGAGIVLKN